MYLVTSIITASAWAPVDQLSTVDLVREILYLTGSELVSIAAQVRQCLGTCASGGFLSTTATVFKVAHFKIKSTKH